MGGAVSHDHHFLERLERIDAPQAELALALYYDSELVRYVLSQVELPEAAERVAISLHDPVEGPFIIVARDGGFVTCLGVGMRPGPDKPVVVRQRLDALAGRIGALRRAMDEAESGTTRCRRLVQKVVEAGDRLSREDFQQLARLTPLLSRHYFRGLVRSVDASLETYARLERARRLTAPRHVEPLRHYWRSTWAMAHFSLLLAADGPHLLEELFEAVEGLSPEYATARGQLLPWSLSRLGVSSFAARGSWVASKVPRALLPRLKQHWLERSTPNGIIAYGLGMCAIGMRHRKLRAEVHKALARPAPAEEEPLSSAMRNVLLAGYELGIGAPEAQRQQVHALGRTFLRRVGADMGPAAVASYERVPDEVAVAVLLAMPFDLHTDNVGLLHVVQWLPWLVEAEAADFYLPAAYMGLRSGPWTPSEAIVLVEPRRKHQHPHGASSVDTSEPLRKRPCPCGSGKKYKRCCGATEGGILPESS
jgi:hypothetical protein